MKDRPPLVRHLLRYGLSHLMYSSTVEKIVTVVILAASLSFGELDLSHKIIFLPHFTLHSNPGGRFDKPTDRDQRSWVFLNDPKKYFATNRKPKKILFEKQNPKKYPQNTIHFAKVKHDNDNNEAPGE